MIWPWDRLIIEVDAKRRQMPFSGVLLLAFTWDIPLIMATLEVIPVHLAEHQQLLPMFEDGALWNPLSAANVLFAQCPIPGRRESGHFGHEEGCILQQRLSVPHKVGSETLGASSRPDARTMRSRLEMHSIVSAPSSSLSEHVIVIESDELFEVHLLCRH